MTMPARRTVLFSAAATALLSACGAGAGKGAAGEDASDMALGAPGAKLQLIEYASLTCPHCREFHAAIWPQLKANYVDTGKVRFIFREYPTDPVELAVAGFQVARCGDASAPTYFTRIGQLFDKQIDLFQAFERGEARDALAAYAKSAGLSDEQFTACIRDEGGMKRVQATVDKASSQYKISGTPTLILNGEVLGQQYLSYSALSKLLDSKLAGR